ncbi:hypothetical protein PHYSODRAFT_333269 [Phytophthora sojae]|uniref:Uncharacterized protein n=1 Tax=Phytophthora sojae (strain P6497) TaxID=1094619 RepID=G4ZME3_PHYSP|nr:hypothetical protein PHYSODRAFT_333269 [Phytophthora sojae]EGZ14996.1 hypothetical protein PHYSODRAFT_333269 [Phytophthora sojae]|eukprot:XP_009528745.1 hypothetical protein PHYSODRAFT_333269 [Phytophthora sojae]
MVRVPGSSGDSGFHRESQEEVRVKKEQGDQASSESGSTTTLLNETRSTDRQSARRTSVGGTEVDPDMDPGEKPQPPPQVPSRTPVDRDESQDPLTKQTKAGQDRYAFADSPVKQEPYIFHPDKTQTKKTATRRKMKAPELEDEDPETSVQDGSKASWIRHMLFNRLKVLVGEIQPKPDPPIPDPRSLQEGSTECRTSSPYVSAAELGSDASSEPRCMSLGPSEASMLRARAKIQREASPQPRSQPRSKKQSAPSVDPTATASGSDMSTGRLESFFQAAMNRFLKEQGALTPAMAPGAVQNHGSRDVEMESTGSSDPDRHWEFDPDDIDFPAPARATEFSGKDQDEDRARAWVSKEKCEHVDHFIETLGDQDLADRLALLRLPDADELEEVLRALDQAKNRQKKSAYGSRKYRQKAPATPAPAAPAKYVRAIQIQPDSGSESGSSDGSDSECDEYRMIYFCLPPTTMRNQSKKSRKPWNGTL